jgi:glycosyltransferase involved in cell wall biosynthesis
MEAAQHNRIVALLGARDTPTDAIEDYCHWLGKALANRGVALERCRVDWPALGWRRALGELESAAAQWRGRWVLLQYTPLSWSRRSVPRRLPRILRMLRRAGARSAVIFHDPSGAPLRPGVALWKRVGDRVRRRLQSKLLRQTCELAEHSFFTVAPSVVDWLGAHHSKASFLPTGANVPTPEELGIAPRSLGNATPTVAIFGITGLPAGEREIALLERALPRAVAACPRFRIVAFGRGTDQSAAALRRAAAACGVGCDVLGLVAAEKITGALAASDVQLFLRGGISSRRGTVAAGLACGLPIVAFRGRETAMPVTDAGVALVPEGDAEALGEALGRVLADPVHRAELSDRSRAAHRHWFSWESIADRLLVALEREAQER